MFHTLLLIFSVWALLSLVAIWFGHRIAVYRGRA